MDAAAINGIETAIDAKIAKASEKHPTKAVAQVLEVEQDGTVWVHIPGGADRTPVSISTADVKPSDLVEVTIENGRAVINGNASNPAAGVSDVRKVADAAENAQLVAKAAFENALTAISESQAAQQAAGEAKDVAEATNQHFWHRTKNTDGLGAGAFVTDSEQEEFIEASTQSWPATKSRTDTFMGDGTTTAFYLNNKANSTTYTVTVDGSAASPTKTEESFTFATAPADGAEIVASYTADTPWHNLLMNSLGILLRKGLKNIASFTHSAVSFFDGLGNAASNVVATFGANGAQIGKSASKHVNVDSEGMSVWNGSNTLATFKANAISLFDGVGSGVNNIVAQFTNSLARLGKPNDKHVDVTSSGMEIFDNATSLAIFGFTGSRIGKASEDNVLLDSDGLKFRYGNRSGIILSSKYSETTSSFTDAIDISSGRISMGGNFYISDSDGRKGELIAIGSNAGVCLVTLEGNSGAFTIQNSNNDDTHQAQYFFNPSGTVDIQYTGYSQHSTGVVVENQGISALFGIGSAGTNHGVYSNTLGKWLLHANDTDIYLNGKNLTSVLANKVFASPDGSQGEATFRSLVAADLPTIPVSKGGTGQTGTTTSTSAILASRDTDNTTAASGTMAKWGKLCQINLVFTTKNQISVPANGNVTNLNLGTLNTGNRPAAQTTWFDYNNGFYGTINTGGVITIQRCDSRNVAYNIAAGTNIVVNVSYVIP